VGNGVMMLANVTLCRDGKHQSTCKKESRKGREFAAARQEILDTSATPFLLERAKTSVTVGMIATSGYRQGHHLQALQIQGRNLLRLMLDYERDLGGCSIRKH